MKLRVIDLFSGAGGFSEGFKQAGYEIVAAVDNDKPSLASHKANHPETVHILDDINNIFAHQLREFEADLIIGGPPCVNFSVANTQPKVEEGFALVDKFLELVKDLDLPFLFENVPGSYKLITKRYGLRGKVSNSVNFGVPQKRDRVFYSDLFFEPLVTHHGGKGAIELLFGGIIYPAVTVADILEHHTEDELKELQPSEAVLRRLDKTLKAHSKKKRLGGFAYGCPISLSKPMQTMLATQNHNYVVYTGFPERNGLNIKELNEPNFTLVTQTDHFLTNKDGWRHFSLVELKRIMGFSDDYIITGSKNQQGRQLGNAVCPPVAKAIAESLKSHFAKKPILQEVKN